MPTTTGFAPTPQVDYSPEGVAYIEEETKEFVQRCVDKMGKDFLASVGTANVAKDLDAMRAALGDDKLTYLGYSYGTRIGSSYAEAYPDKVRAMILDGPVDPNADPIEADIRQAAAFQTAFNNYAADCAATQSDCPLGTDPAKANDVYHSLVDPLVENPAKTKDPRGLSYSDCDSRHDPAAVLAEPVAAPHEGAEPSSREAPATRCWRWRICTWAATNRATTTTPPTPGWRSTARISLP